MLDYLRHREKTEAEERNDRFLDIYGVFNSINYTAKMVGSL